MLSFWGLKPADLDDFNSEQLRLLGADLKHRREERELRNAAARAVIEGMSSGA